MIRLDNLSCSYPRRTVLSGVSLEFGRGELLAIIGNNGSGKSTLIKTVCGIIPPSGGSITQNGTDLSRLPRRERARIAAYLPQTATVPDMTVERFILQGRFVHLSPFAKYTAKDRAIALAAAERLGLADLLSAPLATLSGGTLQRVRIAMALATEAPYLFLDEPAAFLDISHQLSLMQQLRELAAASVGIAAVMHDIHLAFTYADRIAVLGGGTLAAIGTPSEILASGAIERHLGVPLAALRLTEGLPLQWSAQHENS